MKEEIYNKYKEESVQGRYVTLERLQKKWLTDLPSGIVSKKGKSVKGQDIYGLTFGGGKRKVLMWSQMHGNESTTTKAILDLVNFLCSKEDIAKHLLEKCQFLIVPILNPDGAEAYTRVNANTVDLNRDAQNKSQPEMQLLWSLFETFRPDFCFNLHDQRTLFNVGKTHKVATVSFLSPASDPSRSITQSRSVGMKLIAGMNSKLQEEIPGQVGRYDDAFNANCTGDSFQMQEIPTILFEAGHFPGDYEREETRKFIFRALVEALQLIATGNWDKFDTSDYFNIPENQKQFFDVLIKNASVVNPNIALEDSVGIRFEEVLTSGRIHFNPKIETIDGLQGFYGHRELDCSNADDFDALSKEQELLNLLLRV